MAELQTRKTEEDPYTFLSRIDDEEMRRDCLDVLKMMSDATNADPKMWGAGIIGFGIYHYRNESGREAEWFLTGFSPRKQDLSLYIMPGLKMYADLLKELGKHKTGVSCLYIKSLKDVNREVLKTLIEQSVTYLRQNQP